MKQQKNHNYVNTNISSDTHISPYLFSSHCLHYLRQGQGILEYGGDTFELLQGQGFFIPKGSGASLYPVEGTEWKFIWLNLEGDLFEEIISQSSLRQSKILTYDKKQKELFEEILLQRRSLGGNQYLIQGLTMQLLSTFVNTIVTTTRKQCSFDELLTYIHNNLHNYNLNVSELIRFGEYNRTELYSEFKKRLHCSPATYIRKVRLDQARHLLSTTDHSIKQIAHTVGIEDSLYFSRLFKNWNGISPQQFRILSRQKDFDFKKWHDNFK